MEEADRALLESILAAQVLLLAHELREEQRRLSSRGDTELLDEAAQLVREKRAHLVEIASSAP